MIIEGIATNIQDVHDLNQFGGDRIELCGDMDKDGLTPEMALVTEAVEASSIPINVMIRPHDLSFRYTDREIMQMEDQIRAVGSYGANGIVIGALAEDGRIDANALENFISVCGEMDITFHKAFDALDDQVEGLKLLLKYPEVKTILTSGGAGGVIDNFEHLERLMKEAEDTHVTIMPGGGLSTENVAEVIERLKPGSLHFGTGVRSGKSYDAPISKEKIEFIRKVDRSGR
ncbi:copper homeostasis protein CutC [Salinicoccus roseus]|uniref:copper homeostasis protein CutC n=1 Tax=Salinicoccus roseus TaxID=45670 RepID=UPI001EF6A020|nr:copper homeostasis protein CutC [Salinicoccus roseus]MCG7332464.1 copper homeostasis protein CutC [Salinicoccus roseus]